MTLSASKAATQITGQLCNILFLAPESWTWHSWWRSNKCWRDDPVTETQCLPSTDTSILQGILWNTLWVVPPASSSTFSTTDCCSNRNVCFRTPQIMGHLSQHWVIQGTQLQQKASEGKGATFNLCQKFCAWATGEQGKASLGTDLEMTEVTVPKHLQFNALTQFSSISWMSEDCFHTPYHAKLCIRGEALPSWQ